MRSDRLQPAPPIPATVVPYVPRPVTPPYVQPVHANTCPCNTCTKTPWAAGIPYPTAVHATWCRCYTCKRNDPAPQLPAAREPVTSLVPRRDEPETRVPVSNTLVGDSLTVIPGGGGFMSRSDHWHDRLDKQGFIATFDEELKVWMWRKQPAESTPAPAQGATVLPFKSSAPTELGRIYDYETEGW